MNPDADKSHVPNAQNEVVKEERLLREHLAREFFEKREKRIHLHGELFSVENGLMTPTFKLKRPQAKEAFLPVIEAMYESLR